jgi:hypothetical protein
MKYTQWGGSNAYLKKLYDLREKVKIAILGQEDPEFRGELDFLLERVDEKILEVRAYRDGHAVD